jgi:Protein of unknown function (DUF1566)
MPAACPLYKRPDSDSPRWQTTRAWVACGLVCLGSTALAQGAYTFLDDGESVVDAKAGLTWRRCVEGMEWKKGTCVGTPRFFTHPGAMDWAGDEAGRTGSSWRLPLVDELAALAKTRSASAGANAATIDTQVFPATPAARVWTASKAGPHYYQYVAFTDGRSGDMSRVTPAVVRLVRESTKP